MQCSYRLLETGHILGLVTLGESDEIGINTTKQYLRNLALTILVFRGLEKWVRLSNRMPIGILLACSDLKTLASRLEPPSGE